MGFDVNKVGISEEMKSIIRSLRKRFGEIANNQDPKPKTQDIIDALGVSSSVFHNICDYRERSRSREETFTSLNPTLGPIVALADYFGVSIEIKIAGVGEEEIKTTEVSEPVPETIQTDPDSSLIQNF